jgi:STE24 endopeptidase
MEIQNLMPEISDEEIKNSDDLELKEKASVETLDAERQRRAKQYARIQRRLMLLELGLMVVYILIWLFTGWSQGLVSNLAHISAQRWLQALIFTGIFGGIFYLVTLPLSYYEGFYLSHYFGLSNQTQRSWMIDQLKSLTIGALFGGILIEVVYSLLWYSPRLWWLWVGVVLLFFNVIIANLAPVLLFPLFYKFTPLSDERPELVTMLLGLAKRAGTKIQGVYKFDMSQRTKAANAALAGLGNTRRIILGDTLLAEFSNDEIETVLAHELGHQAHHDIPIGIVFSSILTLGGLYLAHLGLSWGTSYWGYQGVGDISAFPLFVLILSFYGLVTMPIGNGFSRWREHKADHYALQMTQKPDFFASAMTRLANQNLAEIDPEAWVVFLLYSHPALNKRIQFSQDWKSKMVE